MAFVGMRELGLDPFTPPHDLRVTVETQRCATDAVQTATGCSLGRGSLVLRDWGKMAATFSTAGGTRAVRVIALDSSRAAADNLLPGIEGRHERQTQAYRVLPDSEMFRVMPVELLEPARGHDRPARDKAYCSHCGEQFEVAKGAHRPPSTCASCAGAAYYRAAQAPQ
jgi:formylmethanofuran dehydrogenase subunit E